MGSIVSSLEAVIKAPTSFWDLEIKEDAIQTASIFQKMSQYIKSYFSSQHALDLKTKVIEILSQFKPKTEREKKLFEKIYQIICACKPSWLYDPIKLRKLPFINVSSSYHLSDHELLQPILSGKRYLNYEGEDIWGQFKETIRLFFPGMLSQATHLSSLKEVPYVDPQEFSAANAREQNLKFFWMGHSTVLLQVEGLNLLLDPSFGFIKPCFKRHIPSPIEFKDLPLIDVVVISHAHEDHCEEATINQLAHVQPVVIAPKSFDWFFRSKGFENVHDLSWWDKREIERNGHTITITSIPAKHNAQRSISDMNCHLWHGVMVTIHDQNIYFAGDTAYDETIAEHIKREFSSIDIAFIPIAPEKEEGVHLNCEQSLQFFKAIGAKKMFPIHFGSYRQGSETIEHPYELLIDFLENDYKHLKDNVILPKMGKAYTFDSLREEDEKASMLELDEILEKMLENREIAEARV